MRFFSGTSNYMTIDSTPKELPFSGKLLSSTLLWCCLLFNFTQFVILEIFSVLDLAGYSEVFTGYKLSRKSVKKKRERRKTMANHNK